jgi:hypothetical protein
MRLRSWLLVATIAVQAWQSASAQMPTPAEAREIAHDAWIFTFPLYEMLRTRPNVAENPDNPRRYAPNTLAHARQLSDHTRRAVTAPNNDTIYSSAWLDLSAGPVVFDMPDVTDRYWSVALLDAYTNNFAYLGTRATRGKGGRFLIAGPAWQGSAAEGQTVIRAPTDMVWLLARILVDGQADLANVGHIQSAMRLDGPPVGEKRRPIADPPAAYIATINRALAEQPHPPTPMLTRMARIGIGPDLTGPPPELAEAVAQGFAEGKAALRRGRFGETIDGWSYPPAHLGNFADDYLYRAVVALVGLAALKPVEAMYMRWEGSPLDGLHRYVLRFEPGQLPAVDGFWSQSLYEVTPEGRLFFTDNPLRRYAIGDRTKGLVRNADGSLEILIAQAPLGGEPPANLLPAPAGPFALIFRAYLPRPELLRHDAVLPAIRRLD